MSWKGSWGGVQQQQQGAWGAQAQQGWGQASIQPKGAQAAKGAAKGGFASATVKPTNTIKPSVGAGAWGQQAAVPAWAQQAKISPMGGKGGFQAVANKGPEFKAKVTKLTAEVETVEKATTGTLNSAKLVFENEKATAASLTASVTSLEKQQTKMNDLIKSLTAESSEARRAGPTAIASVTDLNKLLTKMRALWQNCTSQINKLKPKATKATADNDRKLKETKDTNAFKAVLAQAKGLVTTAENAANEVTKKATPIIASPPEEGEAGDKKIATVSDAATAALKKIETARTELNEKIKSIQTYAPEAKKTANVALGELQKKLADALKTANVYKTFKASLPRLAENQKSIKDISDKLTGHEAAIAKASELAKAAALTKGKVQEIDKHLEPVQVAIREVLTALLKFKSADAVTQEKASKLRTKQEELKTKVKAVEDKIKGQKDAIKSEEAIEQAKELLEKTETCWKQCQEAEMPFLMGVEVLEKEANEKALEECKTAATSTSTAVNAGRNFIRQKLQESRVFEKELAASTKADLDPIQKELDALDAKFNKYRKELNERKVLPLLSEALDSVASFEKHVKAAEAASKGLSSSALEEESVEAITKQVEEAKTAVQEADKSEQEARKLSRAGQSKSGAGHNHPTIVAMGQDINNAHSQLEKCRSSVAQGEKLMKAKKGLASGEEKVKEAEAATKKLKKSVPEGDFSLEQADSINTACNDALKLARAAGSIINPVAMSAPPKAKAALQELLERRKTAETAIQEVLSSTKDRREAARSADFLSAAEKLVKAAEAACAKMEEAESPFLIGASMSSSKSTLELLEKCSAAGHAVQEAVGATRTYMTPKSNDARQFGEAAAKKVKDGFAELNERVKKVTVKHQTFEKDSRERTKEARMMEAGEKTDQYEAAVKKVVAAAEPFTKEGAADMSEADAEKPLNKFLEVDTEAGKMYSATNTFVLARQGEQKANKEHTEALKAMMERIKKAREEVTEKKKSTAPHEKRALGKRLLAECKEQVAGLDAEIKKAADACAPLLEQGGEEFLVSNSLNTLAAALQAHMKAKDTTIEDVFKAAGKGKAMSERAFVKYLTDLPTDIDHDELSAFSDERRVALHKKVASGKGVTQADFENIFRQQYTAIKPSTLTNQFAVEGGETLCKVDMNSAVELFGRHRTDEKGLTRSEAKVGEQTGWITVAQDKNKFLVLVSPFKTFGTSMDKALADGNGAVNKCSNSLAAKSKQGGPATEGPLKEARDEMAKLKEEVAKPIKAMADLKQKVQAAKNTFSQKEQAEKTAHIEARNQKEAAPFLTEPKAKMDALEADAKATQEAGAPMVSLNGDDLKAFATPASVLEAVEKHAAAVKEKAEAAKEAIKEQLEAVQKTTPQSGGTNYARQQLNAMKSKLEEFTRNTTKTNGIISQKCKSMTASKMTPTAECIRKAAQKKGKTIEEFFDSLKKGDKIPEAAFCKLLESLEVDGAALSPEISKLVCRKLEADGISKDVFMKYVVLYYKVVRTIAFTDNMDISACKTLRKGDEGEVVEVLEGPVTDETNGMTRIRAKSLKKDDKTEGWITLSGSKGTAFLEKTVKPAVPAVKPAVK